MSSAILKVGVKIIAGIGLVLLGHFTGRKKSEDDKTGIIKTTSTDVSGEYVEKLRRQAEEFMKRYRELERTQGELILENEENKKYIMGLLKLIEEYEHHIKAMEEKGYTAKALTADITIYQGLSGILTTIRKNKAG